MDPWPYDFYDVGPLGYTPFIGESCDGANELLDWDTSKTFDECRAFCDADPHCVSFEWSHHDGNVCQASTSCVAPSPVNAGPASWDLYVKAPPTDHLPTESGAVGLYVSPSSGSPEGLYARAVASVTKHVDLEPKDRHADLNISSDDIGLLLNSGGLNIDAKGPCAEVDCDGYAISGLATSPGRSAPSCASCPASLCPQLPRACASFLWAPVLMAVGLSEDEVCDLSFSAGQWYYGCRPTCVAFGEGNTERQAEACPPPGQEGVLYCAGMGVVGSSNVQAAAVQKAVQSPGGVHPQCPPVMDELMNVVFPVETELGLSYA